MVMSEHRKLTHQDLQAVSKRARVVHINGILYYIEFANYYGKPVPEDFVLFTCTNLATQRGVTLRAEIFKDASIDPATGDICGSDGNYYDFCELAPVLQEKKMAGEVAISPATSP
jgi:hypothetical protein